MTTIFQTKEFKELQILWYKKLDNAGFQDVERSGRMRQKHFMEYNGYLTQSSLVNERWVEDRELESNSIAHAHYSLAAKFSWYSGLLPEQAPKYLKSRQSGQSSLQSEQTSIPETTQSTPATPAYSKLSRLDHRILQLYSNGSTIAAISKFLRRYYMKNHNRIAGPTGKPYSVYFVHYRLKRLLMYATVWDRLGQPQSIDWTSLGIVLPEQA